MAQLVFSPDWFLGKDIIIDIFSTVIPLFIAIIVLRYYKLSRTKEHLQISLSFFLISFSFLLKILTNFTLYYPVFFTKTIGLVTFTYKTMIPSPVLYYVGFFSFRLLSILGLYALYRIIDKKSCFTKLDHLLNLFLLVCVVLFSHSTYPVYHLTALLLTIIITHHFFLVYKESKAVTSLLMVWSFAIIALSQFIFCLVWYTMSFYAVAEIVQLAGYILLLISFIMVLKHGKKKK